MNRILGYILIGLMLNMTYSVLATPIFNVLETYSGPVGGLYTYSYTVVVDISSTDNVWEFWVHPTAPFDNVVSPMLWDYFTDYKSFIRWFSMDTLYDIQRGQSLPGFSYDSYGVPGDIVYEGSGANDIGDPLGGYIFGPTGGATNPIPEPGTMLMMLSGLVGVVGYFGLRFSKKTGEKVQS